MRDHVLIACGVPLVIACTSLRTQGEPHASCSQASTCAADPPPNEFEVDQCRTEIAGSCGSLYQSYYDCTANDRVCAYDGTTDVLATEGACKAQLAAVAQCADGGGSD